MSLAVLTVRAETDPSHSCLDIKYFWKPQIALLLVFYLISGETITIKTAIKYLVPSLLVDRSVFFF